MFSLLRRKKHDEWTPAPAGDGPVPSYREDPVPSSPSDSGKSVSAVPDAAGDGTPPDSDLGTQTAQLAEGETGTEEAPGRRHPGTARRAAATTATRRSASTTGADCSVVPAYAPAALARRGRRTSPHPAGTVAFMSEPVVPTPAPGSPLEPAGRKLLRLEVRNSQVPIERKPEWIKTRLKTGPEYTELKSLVRREGLHTVCEAAGCPNIYECWEDREATFLIGGDQCTRRCDFCQIDTGKPADFDADEPRRVAESVATMGLRYATVTGVARDDLPDNGAWLYAETVRQIHAQSPAAASSC